MMTSSEETKVHDAARVDRQDNCASIAKNTAHALIPTYAGTFTCIGERCEDTCCVDWDIPLDKSVYERYVRFAEQDLAFDILNFVRKTPDKGNDKQFAILNRIDGGSCPCFGADRKCRIQKQHGASALPSACSIYPRSFSEVNGRLEGALSLSCPEAARHVLLRPDIFSEASDLFSEFFKTDNRYLVRSRGALDSFFIRIRSIVLETLQDRSRPIWQRLLLLASFCSRLDVVTSLGTEHTERTLNQYSGMIGLGSSQELSLLRPDLASRLEFAIHFGDARRRSPDCGQRFRDLFTGFVEGIGAPHGSNPQSTLLRFKEAHRDYLLPLLESYPYIAENYLVNYVYQHLLPFGRTGSESFIMHSMYEEMVLMITHFSWLMTLLAGVAGRYKHDFSQAHIITAAQALTRAVEHSPQTGEELLAYVRAKHLDGLDGLAKLLRNEDE